MNLENFVQFLDFCVVYLVVQLGRGVLCSGLILAVVMTLRKTVLRQEVFLRGFLWWTLLLSLFVGKLKLFYENPLMVKLFFWWNNLCMEQPWLCHLYLLGIMGSMFCMFRRRRKLKKQIKGMRPCRIKDTRILVWKSAVTPFSARVFRPVIVMPEVLLQSCTQEELDAVLLHEKVHIRLGHLWCYLLWDILQSLLWLNPFLTVSRKYFKEDLENICDCVTIQKSECVPKDYGKLLIKTACLLQKEGLEGTAAFAGEKRYEKFKKRIQTIAGFQPYKRRQVTGAAFAAAAVTAGIFIGIESHSYPRYQEENMFVVVDSVCENILFSDSEELEKVISVDGRNVSIDGPLLEQLFQKYGIPEQSFYLGFGGYMKLPGMGGGGNCVYVEYEAGKEDFVIPYEKREDILTTIVKFL
ncbi:MAG: M56 family metallopeptidase [Lachnospiraceae bacterium]|nr:M56 family metallopeptidase [Lachnospiraceae bacterium]